MHRLRGFHRLYAQVEGFSQACIVYIHVSIQLVQGIKEFVLIRQANILSLFQKLLCLSIMYIHMYPVSGAKNVAHCTCAYYLKLHVQVTALGVLCCFALFV